MTRGEPTGCSAQGEEYVAARGALIDPVWRDCA
jgi:hypothetical protein